MLKDKTRNMNVELVASVDRNVLFQSVLFTSSFLASDLKNVTVIPVHYYGYFAVVLRRIFPYFASPFNLKL